MSRSGRASARERMRQERERAGRRRQRNRVLIVVGSAVGAIVIAVIVIVVIRPGGSSGTAGSPVHNAFYNGPFAPVTKNVDHSATMSQPAVKSPVLDIEQIIKSGITGTPTVKLNGKTVSLATLVEPGTACRS